jgi:hypothetical protein
MRLGRSSSWSKRNEPFNNEVRIAATSPMQKALVGVVMLLIGGYIFVTGELSIGDYGDFELTGAHALFLGGVLVLGGLYLTVMNAFTTE